MDAYSYLSVLISIILGLGITQFLTGLGRLLQARAGTRLYPPAVIWAGVLLLAVSVSKDLVDDGHLPAPLNLGTHVLLATLWAVAAATRRDWYHRAVAPATAVVFVAYVAVLFDRLA